MKLKNILKLLVLLSVLIQACAQDKPANDGSFKEEMENLNMTAVNDYLITNGRIGIIHEKDDQPTIIEKFGEPHVSLDSFFLEGMFQDMIMRIDSGKSGELEIHFDQDGDIASVIIDQEKSPYHYKNGIKIGTSLYDLVQINHEPIGFYGFEWDYYGTIADFHNGKLKTAIPYFGGVLIPKINKVDLSAKYAGDRLYSSNQLSEDDQKNIQLQEFHLHVKDK